MNYIKLKREDLPQIIENIEKNGGDASELRAILENMPKVTSLKQRLAEIPDDEVVELIRADSTIQEGEGLVCCVCQQPTSRLTSGVCDSCFRQWALASKKGYLASRRQHGNPSSG